MTSGHGDADAAIATARILRAEGFHVGSVRVGDVEIGLAVVTGAAAPAFMTSGPNAQSPSPRSVMEEWGGPNFARDLGATQPDLVDDDEQPAVRS